MSPQFQTRAFTYSQQWDQSAGYGGAVGIFVAVGIGATLMFDVLSTKRQLFAVCLAESLPVVHNRMCSLRCALNLILILLVPPEITIF